MREPTLFLFLRSPLQEGSRWSPLCNYITTRAVESARSNSSQTIPRAR